MTGTDATLRPDAVGALLAKNVAPDLRCDSVVRGAVGNGQETWFVEAADAGGRARRFVLRRSATAGVLDDTDREHEFATLRALQDQGLPTPRVHWLETEPSSLHRPFFVMDRLPGSPPAPRSPEEAATIAHDLGRRLAELHRSGVPAGTAEDVRACTEREIDRWRARYLSRRLAPVPMIGALLAWLSANLPNADVDPVLLWGDAGPHNILVEDGCISALLDWELSHGGHPMEDLGAAVWACLGRYPQEDVIAGYEAVSGAPVDRDLVAYFAVLGCVSRSVMQLAGVSAFVHGETSALNLAGLGLALPVANLLRAAQYAGWPSVPGPAPAAEPGDDELRLRPDVAETLGGIARFLHDDVLPATDSAYLRRGLKTAVALLGVSVRRGREDPVRSDELRAHLDAVFDRLASAGVAEPGEAHDAAALERIAARVESDPACAGVRPDVRRALVTDLRTRATSLEAVVHLYGADVRPGEPFRR